MLEEASETLGAPVEVGETQAGRHPEAIRPLSDKCAGVQQCRAGAERILREPLGLAVVFDQTDGWGGGEQPEIVVAVFVHVIHGQTGDDRNRTRDLPRLDVHVKQAAVANEPDLPALVFDDAPDPPHELTRAVIQVVRECLGRRVEPVQTAVQGSEP